MFEIFRRYDVMLAQHFIRKTDEVLQLSKKFLEFLFFGFEMVPLADLTDLTDL